MIILSLHQGEFQMSRTPSILALALWAWAVTSAQLLPSQIRAMRAYAANCGWMVALLADAPLLPFDFRNLAQTVDGYLAEIAKLKGAGALHLESARKELGLVKKNADAYESRYRRSFEKASGARASLLAS